MGEKEIVSAIGGMAVAGLIATLLLAAHVKGVEDGRAACVALHEASHERGN